MRIMRLFRAGWDSSVCASEPTVVPTIVYLDRFMSSEVEIRD